jgi:hypothetical protein
MSTDLRHRLSNKVHGRLGERDRGMPKSSLDPLGYSHPKDPMNEAKGVWLNAIRHADLCNGTTSA